MAKTLVENQICNACGADVRDGALFCYNCGKSVAPEILVEEGGKKNEVGDVLLREKIAENGNRETIKESATLETIADKPIPKPDIQAETELKAAGAIRRKSKTFQKKTVEVVWEEYENASNPLFILAALLLTLFAIGILLLAIYLK